MLHWNPLYIEVYCTLNLLTGCKCFRKIHHNWWKYDSFPTQHHRISKTKNNSTFRCATLSICQNQSKNTVITLPDHFLQVSPSLHLHIHQNLAMASIMTKLKTNLIDIYIYKYIYIMVKICMYVCTVTVKRLWHILWTKKHWASCRCNWLCPVAAASGTTVGNLQSLTKTTSLVEH